MWKYIAIIAFFILAVREINLMKESIYVTPDNKDIVSADKTIISKVINILENEAKYFLKDQKDNNKTKQTSISTKIKTQEVNTTLSNKVKSIDLSKIEKATTLPTLQDMENNESIKKLPTLKQVEINQKETLTDIHSEIKKEVHPQQSLPTHFQSAQERVNAILQDMRSKK